MKRFALFLLLFLLCFSNCTFYLYCFPLKSNRLKIECNSETVRTALCRGRFSKKCISKCPSRNRNCFAVQGWQSRLKQYPYRQVQMSDRRLPLRLKLKQRLFYSSLIYMKKCRFLFYHCCVLNQARRKNLLQNLCFWYSRKTRIFSFSLNPISAFSETFLLVFVVLFL